MKYCARILRPQFVFFQGHLEEATGARPSKYWFQPSDIVLGPNVRNNHHIIFVLCSLRTQTIQPIVTPSLFAAAKKCITELYLAGSL